MKLRFKLGLAALVVLVASVVAFFASGLAYRFLPLGHDYSKTPSQVRIELMPQSSPVWLEKHFTGTDGKDTLTFITYRNGNLGTSPSYGYEGEGVSTVVPARALF